MEYHEYTEEEKETFRNDPEGFLQMRKAVEREISTSFPIFIQGSERQKSSVEYIKQRMIEKIGNQELADKLIPDFALGCRRLTVSGCSSATPFTSD